MPNRWSLEDFSPKTHNPACGFRKRAYNGDLPPWQAPIAKVTVHPIVT